MADKDIYIKAINTFGPNQQIIKSMEELGELTTALARHFFENKEDVQNIHEEIADVEIMLNQLKIIFNEDEINKHKEQKLKKLKGIVW